MRLCVFGQSAFGAGVVRRLVEEGHEIRAVFTAPDAKPGAKQMGRGIIVIIHQWIFPFIPNPELGKAFEL